MKIMKEQLLGLVFGCLLMVASANFVYRISDLDGRYPEYIVEDFRIKCNEAGFFPHPANCSWFYRCVDESVRGYFHVFFFQCEPGTVFLDEIDQCVYGSKTSPPCSPGEIGVNPPTVGSPAPPPINTPKPIPQTPPTPPEPFTTTQDPSTNSPTSTETTPQETDAPTSGPQPPVTEPETNVPDTTTSPPESSPLPPAPPPKLPVDIGSTTLCRNCTDARICLANKRSITTKICEACKFGPGDFVKPADRCSVWVPDPVFNDQGRCMSGKEICPAERQDQLQDLQEAFTFRCSDVKSRPDVPEIRSLYCRNYNYCSPDGNYQGTQNLCSNFYQCYKTWNGGWSTQVRNCLGRNLYSFEQDQCVPAPRAEEQCPEP